MISSVSGNVCRNHIKYGTCRRWISRMTVSGHVPVGAAMMMVPRGLSKMLKGELQEQCTLRGIVLTDPDNPDRQKTRERMVRDIKEQEATPSGSCADEVSRPESNAEAAEEVPTASDAFREKVVVDGVTVVATEEQAQLALAELERLRGQPHAWDTESAGILVGKRGHSPVSHGQVVCATCFCGGSADFGNGPRLIIDNHGPASGLLARVFGDYFADDTQLKVFHNYSFDRHLLAREGIRVNGFYADTLHLARFVDTSLAGWEGRVSHNMLTRGGSRPSPTAKPESQGESQVRTVVGMRIGRQPVQQSSKGGLHTLTVSAASGADSVAGAQVRIGYGLKSLATHFSLTDGKDRQDFSQMFGKGDENASLDNHNSAAKFATWADYATTDAVLTHRLYSHLRQTLEARRWYSMVHERPIEDVLRDKKVAKCLLHEGVRYAGAAQHDTSRSMWDLFSLYFPEFGECLADMEQVGVGVDLEALRSLNSQIQVDIDRYRVEFLNWCEAYETVGERPLAAEPDHINTRSSSQLQHLLFGGNLVNTFSGVGSPATRVFPAKKESIVGNKHVSGTFELNSMGLLASEKRGHRTAKGAPSVSKAVLREFAGDPLKNGKDGLVYKQLVARGESKEKAEEASRSLGRLADMGSAQAIKSSFVQSLIERASTTERIHPSWKFDTSTGRLTCSQPNLQNIPSKKTDKYGVRSAICAAPGKTLVVADYSQLELHVLAQMTRSEAMITKLSSGGDYHSEVTAELFPEVAKALGSGKVVISRDASRPHVPTVKEVFAEQRLRAKQVTFSIVYGRTARSLGEELGMSRFDAQDLINRWFDNKKEVVAWIKQVSEEAKSGHVLSMLGRWRTLPLIKHSDWETKSTRAAVNFCIQGSAADIVIAAMLTLRNDQRLKDLGFRLVLQVHDEIVLEGPEGHAELAGVILREVMIDPFKARSSSFKFRVPLSVELGIGRTWLEAMP